MAEAYIRQSTVQLSIVRQSVIERICAEYAGRDAVAILAMAPLAAAVSVSPASPSDTEELCARLVVTSRNGSACMHVIFGPQAAARAPQELSIPAKFRAIPRTSRGPPETRARLVSSEFATSVA
jgi:hypothetical protein